MDRPGLLNLAEGLRASEALYNAAKERKYRMLSRAVICIDRFRNAVEA